MGWADLNQYAQSITWLIVIYWLSAKLDEKEGDWNNYIKYDVSALNLGENSNYKLRGLNLLLF